MKSARQVAARLVSTFAGRLYRRKQVSRKPIRYDISWNLALLLYPDGQIAELLYNSLYFYPIGKIAGLLGIGGFERSELGLTIAQLRQGMHVVDIGANVGLYSIIADKIVGPAGKVWAFEPSTQTYGSLIRNLRLNGCVSVTPAKVALGEKSGCSMILKRDAGQQDGERYLLPESDDAFSSPDAACGSGDSELVPVSTLDDYFVTQGMPRLDFLKMDVEGGEFAIFKGARRVLMANPEITLMFECTPQGCDRYGHAQADVFAFLQDLGFGMSCWNAKRRVWESGQESLALAGNIWACRSRHLLPSL
jgi:FkbM family methyltransferase